MTGNETFRLLPELMGDTMVEISINDSSSKYRVERDTLRSSSSFLYSQIELYMSLTHVFAKLNLREPQEALEILVYSIARKHLPRDDLKATSIENASALLSKLWYLGSKHDMPTLQDEVRMELLQALKHDTAGFGVIKYVFEHSKPGDPIRELMAEELVWYA